MAKAFKDARGGLTAAGRADYNRRTGAHLRPGVQGPADTPDKMRRKGSFLRRMFTTPQGPLTDVGGKPTRLALSAQAWGEKIPKTAADVEKLAEKGKRLLDMYTGMKTKNPADDFRGSNYRIAFTTDKRGNKIAYREDVQQGRNFRIGMADAEMLLATGQAKEVPYHSFTAASYQADYAKAAAAKKQLEEWMPQGKANPAAYTTTATATATAMPTWIGLDEDGYFGKNVFARVHWKGSKPFNAKNAVSRPWGDDDAKPVRGYSSVTGIPDLIRYFQAHGEPSLSETVIIYSGKSVGVGPDNEDLSVPDMVHVYKTTYGDLTKQSNPAAYTTTASAMPFYNAARRLARTMPTVGANEGFKRYLGKLPPAMRTKKIAEAGSHQRNIEAWHTGWVEGQKAAEIARRNPKTKLDLYLDGVVSGKREVSFDVRDGYTQAQKDRIIAEAEARGLHAASDGKFILVRDLRKMHQNPLDEYGLDKPIVPEPPRPLAKVYGPNWRNRPDAAELQKAFTKAASARSKALKAYKAYVDQSNVLFWERQKESKGNPDFPIFKAKVTFRWGDPKRGMLVKEGSIWESVAQNAMPRGMGDGTVKKYWKLGERKGSRWGSRQIELFEDQIGQVMERQNGSHVGSRKPNPESDAAAVYEEFHGVPSTEILEVDTPILHHKNLAVLGTLVSLKVQPAYGRSRNAVKTLSFADCGVMLSSNETKTALYFSSGDQSLPLEDLGLTKPEYAKDLMLIGTLHEVTYNTQKKFDKLKSIDYYHGLGEKTKERPVLLYNPITQQMSMAGGAYTIEDRGIVN